MPVYGAKYLLFLVISATGVFYVPRKWRPYVLLCASIAFYLLSGAPLILLIMPLLGAYAGALALEKWPAQNRWILTASLAVVLAPLIYFKTNPTIVSFGLSFFTFHVAGYLIDVALGRARAEKQPAVFALYGSFFPTLTAGPIERSNTLLPQCREIPDFDGTRVRDGVFLILVGLIKWALFANPLAPAVVAVFANPAKFSGGEILFGTFLARYQLYFEFSSAIDIALGSAAILGISLTPNFNRPFAARSVADFWRRWHISLTTWMRDYIFYPLAASIGHVTGITVCVMVAFIALGLWHGFTWNFALYGLVQGVLLGLHRGTEAWRAKFRVHAAFQIGLTLLITASLPMILFQTPDLHSAAAMAKGLVSVAKPWGDFTGLWNLGVPWIKIGGYVLAFELLSYLNACQPLLKAVARQHVALQWVLGFLLFAIFIALGTFEAPFDFAYRNF